jgi:hypothetical protein
LRENSYTCGVAGRQCIKVVERLRIINYPFCDLKRCLHTSYPALKLRPNRYGLCRFLFLRNLLRRALRREMRSLSGKGAVEHRESRALYRAIAGDEISMAVRAIIRNTYLLHDVVSTV